MKIRLFFLAVLISLTSVTAVFAAPGDCAKACAKKSDEDRKVCMAIPGSRIPCFEKVEGDFKACNKACV